MAVFCQVLGPVAAAVDGVSVDLGGLRQRAVLASLLLRAGQVVPVAAIVDDVWPHGAPDSAVNLVQGYVSGLRKVLGRAAVATSEPGYRLATSSVETDLQQFEGAVRAAHRARTEGRDDRAVLVLTEALTGWRGPALADLAAEGIATAAAARLDELRVAATEELAEAYLAVDDVAAAASVLERLTAEHPYRERPVELLMTALWRQGRRADALATYREARQRMVDELGIEPGAELQELHAALLRERIADAPSARRWPVAATPRPARVLAATLDVDRLTPLSEVCLPLAAEAECILAAAVRGPAELGVAGARIAEVRAASPLAEWIRTAVFTSPRPGSHLSRLAVEQDCDLVVVQTDGGDFEDVDVSAMLDAVPCDLALLSGGDDYPDAGPVTVVFRGGAHDWAAVELGAWCARVRAAPLRLVGAQDPSGDRDVSRQLASASLATQRAFGLTPEPVLAPPDPAAVVAACAGSGLVLAGLTERWRQAGPGRTRAALARAAGFPTLLVRHGVRPSPLSARDFDTRFTWTVATLT